MKMPYMVESRVSNMIGTSTLSQSHHNRCSRIEVDRLLLRGTVLGLPIILLIVHNDKGTSEAGTLMCLKPNRGGFVASWPHALTPPSLAFQIMSKRKRESRMSSDFSGGNKPNA
jgi:hypothetical protein